MDWKNITLSVSASLRENCPLKTTTNQQADMTTPTKLIRKEELRFKKVVTGDQGNDLRKRTMSFALRIVRMFSALPKTTEAQILGKQVLRSGTSVGANYREAFRARSKPEFIPEKLAPLQRECDELTAIFVSIIKSSRRSTTTS
jgi:23S rRNA-intervening sequence protein